MGFLDWITGKIECPRCGTRGAKEINGSIHCTNPTCAYFSKVIGKGDTAPARASITFRQPEEAPAGYFAIQYRNFRGVEKTFMAEAESARRSQNHISVKVAPTGARIALSRDRIQNLREVETACPQSALSGQNQPTPRERQILTYHKNRGSTSPLFESVRAKYPHW